MVASLLNLLRNHVLYPVPNGVGGYQLPEQMLSVRDANDLLRRVRSIVNKVSSQL